MTIDEIMSNVKLELKSYDEVGIIDESNLFKHFEWIFNRLNTGVMQKYSLILDVEDFKAEIPFNFKMLDWIYKCSSCSSGQNTYRYYLHQPYTWKQQDYVKKICYDKCCIKEEHEVITRSTWIETTEQVDTFCDKKLLSLHEAVPKDKIFCDCPNIHCFSENYFNMDKKNFYFNFEEGTVYIHFWGYEVDEDNLPVIPDDPYIQKAIEDYLIFKAFSSIYYNTESDVAQKLSYAQTMHAQSLAEALYNIKLPTHQKLMKWGKLRADNYKIFNIPSLADAKHHVNKGNAKRY